MNITLPLTLTAPDGRIVGSITMGSAEGDYPCLQLYKADVINVRNFQGGTADNPNLDISAGGGGEDAEHPRGHVSVQWDNGSDTVIFDGAKNALLRCYGGFGHSTNQARTIHSDAKHYFHAGAYVPASGGGWRKL